MDEINFGDPRTLGHLDFKAPDIYSRVIWLNGAGEMLLLSAVIHTNLELNLSSPLFRFKAPYNHRINPRWRGRIPPYLPGTGLRVVTLYVEFTSSQSLRIEERQFLAVRINYRES